MIRGLNSPARCRGAFPDGSGEVYTGAERKGGDVRRRDHAVPQSEQRTELPGGVARRVSQDSEPGLSINPENTGGTALITDTNSTQAKARESTACASRQTTLYVGSSLRS